ncbi:hypothetical protein B0H19DRAFT_692554 [Mycena capillaripes]|nr:hypothetical protein B0H19DRAFT_692554 [Mycena capillaripes]
MAPRRPADAQSTNSSPLSPTSTSSSRDSWFRRPKKRAADPDATSAMSTSTSTSSTPAAPSRDSRPPVMHVEPDPWSYIVLPPSEQLLRNPDLVGKIMGHVSSGRDHRSLKAQRQALLWIALSCKAMSSSAMRFLWRRLDNLLPLLYLLPSFTTKNGKSSLYGASNPYEWQSFDRHAAYVKEIVYEDIPDTIQIDPSVYLRLFLRNSSILPSLERFVCKTSARPSESEILLYMQSPVRALELGTFELGTLYSADTGKMALTREAVVTSLSGKPSQITSLTLVDQPFSILSEGIPMLHLTKLELRAMYGVMDAIILRQIGSLPRLQSFTVDSGCFTGLNLSNMSARFSGSTPSHFQHENESSGGMFAQLTHLEVERHPSLPNSSIALFLQLIGSSKLRSLILRVRTLSRAARGKSRTGRGRGAIPDGASELHGDSLQTIARRWPKLRTLDLEIDHSHGAISHLLHRLPVLRTLRLSGYLHVADSDSVDICSAFTNLTALQNLSLRCRDDSNTPFRFHIGAITRLVPMCPRLQTLDIALSGPTTTPALSSSRSIASLRTLAATQFQTSHNLRTFAVHYSDPFDNRGAVLLARHLDRLFPKLNTIRYDDPDAEGESESENGMRDAWAQVQELVFAFQDVRNGE